MKNQENVGFYGSMHQVIFCWSSHN